MQEYPEINQSTIEPLVVKKDLEALHSLQRTVFQVVEQCRAMVSKSVDKTEKRKSEQILEDTLRDLNFINTNLSKLRI